MFCLRLPVGPGSVGPGPARVPELIRTYRRPTQQLSPAFSPELPAQPLPSPQCRLRTSPAR